MDCFYLGDVAARRLASGGQERSFRCTMCLPRGMYKMYNADPQILIHP